MKRILIISFTLLKVIIYSQNYLWPTNAGYFLSSTFGEYRPGHFHTGIDIKTNQRLGYPVYAIDDGYIFIIKTSPYGYGKVLYHRLKDNKIAVYAHLDRFADKFESIVKRNQERIARYTITIDLTGQEIPVKRGEIIAYTGESGTGGPHLHFEIRDPDNNPINPLHYIYKINDKTIPTIKEVLFLPAEKNSRIFGLPDPVSRKAFYINKNIWKIESPVYISGPFCMELLTYDTRRGVRNKYSPYMIQVNIDDSLYFQVKYDTISFNWTKFVELDRDLRMIDEDNNFYHRLYKSYPEMNIPIYSGNSDGRFNLPHGLHQCKINVYDYNMNKSTLKFTIVSVALKELEMDIIKVTNDTLALTIKTNRISLNDIKFQWVNRYGVKEYEVERLSSVVSDTVSTVYIKNIRNPYFLKIWGANDSTYYKPLFIKSGDYLYDANNDVELKLFVDQTIDMLFFKLNLRSPMLENKQFYLQVDDELVALPFTQVSPTEYNILIPGKKLLDKACAIEIRSGKKEELVYRGKIDMHIISPDTAGIIKSSDSLFSVVFEKKSVFDTLTCWINKSVYNNWDAYTIYPTYAFLNKNIRLEYFDKESKYLHPGKVAIYYIKNKPKFLQTYFDTSGVKFYAEYDKFGLFAIAEDLDPPYIINSIPYKNGKYKSGELKEIKIYFDDNLSGIADDSMLKMYIDNQQVIPELNGVLKYLRYRLEKNLNIGEHEIKVILVDKCGNSLTSKIPFKIIGQ